MSSDILPFYERSASRSNADNIDSKYFRAIGMILPKNSGTQVTYTDYHLARIQADNQNWTFRPYAIAMVEASEYGIASLSSEGGMAVRQFNTFRQEQSLSSKNMGPKADMWDKVFYGKEKFEANE